MLKWGTQRWVMVMMMICQKLSTHLCASLGILKEKLDCLDFTALMSSKHTEEYMNKHEKPAGAQQ